MERRYIFKVEPVAKGRPRISSRGGFARAYTPAKTRTFEKSLATLATALNKKNNWKPLACAIEVNISFFLTKPKSRKKYHYPSVRPDLDNMVKCIDSLNGIAWKDDNLICTLGATKQYSQSNGYIILDIMTLEIC